MGRVIEPLLFLHKRKWSGEEEGNSLLTSQDNEARIDQRVKKKILSSHASSQTSSFLAITVKELNYTQRN